MLRVILYLIYRALELAILAYCIMSWFASPGSRVRDIYVKMAYYLEPMFKPARMLLSRLNLNLPIDLSPWITLIFLSIIYRVIAMLI